MKKVIVFLISFFLFINVSALEIYERVEPNLGINKKIDINYSNKNKILNTPLIDSSLKVYDFANVLTDVEISLLKEKSLNYLSKTGMEMIFVLIDETYTDSQIQNFADDFYDYNDFGLDNSSYSGILVVRNVNDYNRYYYMTTSGEAQMYYDSNRIDNILDDMWDNMHNDNYYDGFIDFYNSSLDYYNDGILSKYEGCHVDYKGDLYDKNNKAVSWDKGIYRAPYMLAIILSTIVGLIVVKILKSKNKMVKKAISARDYLNNKVDFNKKEDNFISTHTSSYTISSSSGGGSGSSGSHHSSSGFSHGGGGRHC